MREYNPAVRRLPRIMLHSAAAGSVVSLVGLMAWRCFTPTPQRLSAIITMAMRESPVYEADYDAWWQLVS
jgi:hypothetical protein